MLNTLLGGFIAITSGVIIGILTPSINSRIQDKKVSQRQLLNLMSALYLLRNNLINYLHQDIFMRQVGEIEAGETEVKKMGKLSAQIDENLSSVYRIQLETITNFKEAAFEIRSIFDLLDDLENFIWIQKLQYNSDKVIYDQATSDRYSVELDKMMNQKFSKKIESIIEINRKMLK